MLWLAAHSLHCLGIFSAPGLASVSHPLDCSIGKSSLLVFFLVLLVLVVQFMFPASLALEAHLLYSCLDQHSYTPVAGLAHPPAKDFAFLNRMWVRSEPFHYLVQDLLLEESLQC